MTLKDVAVISGCSVATVSKVFKNSEEISENTKNKVLDAAKRVGYLQKATTHTAVLGGIKTVIFADKSGKALTDFAKFEKAAKKVGITLLYTVQDEKSAAELFHQTGSLGLVIFGKTNISGENIFSFDGDEKALAEFLKFVGEIKTKRQPRSKSNAVKPTKTVENKAKIDLNNDELSKNNDGDNEISEEKTPEKNTEIWLL